MRKGILWGAVCALFMLVGCTSYEGDFVQKSEEELAQMEQMNDSAHESFMLGDYATAQSLLQTLGAERTVSRPLYQMEMVSALLLAGKFDEAHDVMMNLHNDFETLFDEKLADKATSVWHGEVNKVYKGDSYERATFYALMALSYIRLKNYEDALRCVKNGLLADADSSEEKAMEDYALLHYLGYLAAKKMNDDNEAAEYWRFLMRALAARGITLEDQDGKLIGDNCFDRLKGRNPNVLLVVWCGLPPTIMCTGEYKEIRSIIRGVNPFDALNVEVGGSDFGFMPNQLGDIDYQATTRGGRLMDEVLADKALAKKSMEVSRNVLFVIGTGCLIAGSRAMSAPPVGLSLMGAGLGCYALGGTAWIIGNLMNPAADARYWRNLPGQFYIFPLELPVGSHQVRISGFSHSDRLMSCDFRVNVSDAQAMNVVHLPMMIDGQSFLSAAREKLIDERVSAVEKASWQRMAKELK